MIVCLEKKKQRKELRQVSIRLGHMRSSYLHGEGRWHDLKGQKVTPSKLKNKMKNQKLLSCRQPQAREYQDELMKNTRPMGMGGVFLTQFSLLSLCTPMYL